MAVYNDWAADVYIGSWLSLGNFENLSISVGRQFATDQWPVARASLRKRFVDGFQTVNPNWLIGKPVRIFAPGRSSTEPTWTGRIADLTFEVGKSQRAVITPPIINVYYEEDYLIIECEGEGGTIGRNGDFTLAATTNPIDTYLVQNVGETIGSAIRCDTAATFGDYDTISTPQGDFNAWDTLQNVATYTAGRIIDGVRKKATDWSTTVGATGDPGVDFKSAVFTTADEATVRFSDQPQSATSRIYDEFTVRGSSQDFFTSSSVDGTFGASTATYTAVAAGATPPYRQFAARAYGESASLLQGTAELWANSFSVSKVFPASISAQTGGQTTQNLDTLGFTDIELAYLTTKTVRVDIRGRPYRCRIEGVTVYADLNQSRFTYYLSPVTDTTWFILDDDTYGELSTSKLGLY